MLNSLWEIWTLSCVLSGLNGVGWREESCIASENCEEWLLCCVLIVLLAVCLPHELTSSAELSVWMCWELHMEPWCTICLLLTLVAELSGSFLQGMVRGEGPLIFVRIIPKGSGDGEEVLCAPPLHAPSQRAYKPFCWHLGLLHSSLVRTDFCSGQWQNIIHQFLRFQGSTSWRQVWNTCVNKERFVLFFITFHKPCHLKDHWLHFWSVKTRGTFSSTFSTPLDPWL